MYPVKCKSPIPLSFMPAIHIQSVQLTISENQWNYRDKIPRLVKNFIRTDTYPLFTKHRVAGQPLNIPLMYNLVLWDNFLIKKVQHLYNIIFGKCTSHVQCSL